MWAQYCEQLYDDPTNTVLDISVDELEPSILLAEIEAAIRKLKVNKSPGIDLITAEYLKSLGPEGTRVIHISGYMENWSMAT